jgi:hypothetical protein
MNGTFESPLKHILPEESHPVHFQLILPRDQKERGYFSGDNISEIGKLFTKRPICILLAPTGEHTFARRRLMMAVPLAKAGIGSLIIQNPFYGERKPKSQFRSRLLYVIILFQNIQLIVTTRYQT